MLADRYVRMDFTSQEDFEQNYTLRIPDRFNFAYDIVDEYARLCPEKPAMMGNLEPMSARGFFLRNAKNVEFHNVTLKNADGEAYDTDESVDGEF